jgi:hypothetical protein
VSRIQVNIETSVPICGEKPLRGPMMFNPSSTMPPTAPAIDGDDKPAAPSPQPKTAEAFKKLRRLLGFIYLNGLKRCTISTVLPSNENKLSDGHPHRASLEGKRF